MPRPIRTKTDEEWATMIRTQRESGLSVLIHPYTFISEIGVRKYILKGLSHYSHIIAIIMRKDRKRCEFTN